MTNLKLTAYTLALIITANAQAFAGNLVSEGLDDPHVVQAREYPEWDCYPWMPEDFNSYRHYRNHKAAGWCDIRAKADGNDTPRKPQCESDCGTDFETKAEAILRVHGVYNTNDLSPEDWAAVGAFWDANGGPNAERTAPNGTA